MKIKSSCAFLQSYWLNSIRHFIFVSQLYGSNGTCGSNEYLEVYKLMLRNTPGIAWTVHKSLCIHSERGRRLNNWVFFFFFTFFELTTTPVCKTEEKKHTYDTTWDFTLHLKPDRKVIEITPPPHPTRFINKICALKSK